MAPSGDNTQPWRFRWDGLHLHVTFVSERARSLYEARWAASWISLGAVLTNIALAAGARGVRIDATTFPADDAPDVVARIRLESGALLADPLMAAIPDRCVNRRAYQRVAIPATVRDEIAAEAAAIPGLALAWHDTDRAKRQIAALAAQNDRVLFENRTLHDGLFRWLRWSTAEVEGSRDGMPIVTMELTPFERAGFRVLRSWPWARLAAVAGITRGLPLRARSIYRRSGALALLSTEGDAPDDFVRGGQVLQRIWLTATLRGLAFQPITGITFLLLRLRLMGGDGLSQAHRRLLQRLDREFREIFPSAGDRVAPVMLFRVGVASPPSARAPRLPLDQILTVETPRD